jgi:hypothetical protein
MYVSAYRGERHRTIGPVKPRRWSRLRTMSLLLVLAVVGFWAVRLTLWSVMYWRQQRG